LKKRGPAVALFGTSDDEWAESIIGEPDVDPSIEKSRAINDVKGSIESLRRDVRELNAERRPSKASKTIDQVIGHAEALAACIEKLSPFWRKHLCSRVFSDRVDYIPVLEAASFVEVAEVRKNEWVGYLKRIPNEFGPRLLRARDYRSGPQDLCAFTARELIMVLSPATEFNKGEDSEFCRVTSKLWQAATGQEQNMRRACDRVVDLVRPQKLAKPIKRGPHKKRLVA